MHLYFFSSSNIYISCIKNSSMESKWPAFLKSSYVLKKKSRKERQIILIFNKEVKLFSLTPHGRYSLFLFSFKKIFIRKRQNIQKTYNLSSLSCAECWTWSVSLFPSINFIVFMFCELFSTFTKVDSI